MAPCTHPPPALAEFVSPTARQPLPCHPARAAHPAAHRSDTTSHIGQQERAQEQQKEVCIAPQSTISAGISAFRNSQEPCSTWGRKSRAHQRPVNPFLLHRTHPSTHAVRKSREAATAQVIALGAAGHKTSRPVLHTHPVSGMEMAATQLTRSIGNQLHVEEFSSIISTIQPQSRCLTPVSQAENQLSSQSRSPRSGVTTVRRC